MNNPDRLPFLEVLELIKPFNPVKVCFLGDVLFDNYTSDKKETESYLKVIPEKLNNTLKTYDIWVNSIEIFPLAGNRSLVYLKGTRILKGYFDNCK